MSVTTQRLQSIEVRATEGLALVYNITYESTAVESWLSSVTQCDAGNPPACLPPLTFRWQDLNNGFLAPAIGASIAPRLNLGSEITGFDLKSVFFGDLNGDGTADMYRIHGLASPQPNDTLFFHEPNSFSWQPLNVGMTAVPVQSAPLLVWLRLI